MSSQRWYLFLVCGLLVALNTSQSLLDVFETLIVITVIYLSFSLKKNLFSIISKPLIYTLVALFSATVLSYIFGVPGFNNLKVAGVLESRWALIFPCVVVILNQIQWDQKPLTATLYAFSIATVVNFIYYFIHDVQRAGGLFHNPMFYAQNLAPLVLILLNIYFYLLFQKSKNDQPLERQPINNHKKLELIVFASLTIGAVLLLLTQTRGVWLGFLFAGTINLFFLQKKFAFKVAAVFLVIIVTIVTTSTTMRSRIIMDNDNQKYSKVARFIFWSGNFELFKSYPVFGVGYGINNQIYYNTLSEDKKEQVAEELQKTHAHNQYIQYLAGTGLFGLLSYLSFAAVALFYAAESIKRSRKDSIYRFISIGLFLGIICFLVSGLTESNFNIAKNRSFFLLLVASSFVMYRKILELGAALKKQKG